MSGVLLYPSKEYGPFWKIWEAVDYFPDEAAIWEDIILEQDTADCLVRDHLENTHNQFLAVKASTNEGYVGHCQFPSTPEDRLAEDAASQDSDVLSHFLTSLTNVCPEAYQAAKLLVLGTSFGNDVAADIVDDFERLLVGLLGHSWLLNRQQGGYYDGFEVINEHKVMFTNLQTRIVDRWIARSSHTPVPTRFPSNS
ncbi:hypothetical protein BGW37DRAFT_517834 [Umbelopsis sp. PMI_123]|nr:hypothetical protein BGW37DRAFT_517834 [Umbelopsis sp. PMI_123]